MKVQVLSDLHLEFEDFDIDCMDADVLILAGDIHVGDKGISWLLDRQIDIPVIYVLGNHEYYRHAYPKLLDSIRQRIVNTNIVLLENESFQIEQTIFYGCTLWTDFDLFGSPKVAGFECQQRLNDFKKIRRTPGYSKLRSVDVAMIHASSLRWLTRAYDHNSDVKRVIVTHHAPSALSLPDAFKHEVVSAGYASHLDPLIHELSPDLWVHGHLHSASDYYVGTTRIVCNPRGYPGQVIEGFDPRHMLEL